MSHTAEGGVNPGGQFAKVLFFHKKVYENENNYPPHPNKYRPNLRRYI